MCTETRLPVINVSALIGDSSDKTTTARLIGDACQQFGFFYIRDHGIDRSLQQRLERLCRQFFDQPLEVKQRVRIELSGLAVRGFIKFGNEVTAGKLDVKECYRFAEDHRSDHPLVRSQTPLFGQNLYPDIPGFRETIVAYMSAMRGLADKLLEGIAISLGLDPTYFFDRYTNDPMASFSVCNYPVISDDIMSGENCWGVGEHCDYGVLTILKQDNSGGLQVKTIDGVWMDAEPIEDMFVCNIGDMLDRMTGGLYRSTPHRVRRQWRNDRLSFPFFFEPNFDAVMRPIEEIVGDRMVDDDRDERYDGLSVRQIDGTHGDYMIKKFVNNWPHLKLLIN